MNFNTYLNEAKQVGILYKYINLPMLVKILNADCLFPNLYKQPIPGEKQLISGVSLTRLGNKQQMRTWYGRAMIAINGDILSNNYKLVPVDDVYLRYGKKSKPYDHQAEELVITPLGIKPLSRYVDYILLQEEDFEVYTTPKKLFYLGSEIIKKFKITK